MKEPTRVAGARWVLRGALLFALAFANLNDIWSPDVVPNTLFAWTVLREGDFDHDEFSGIPRDSYFFRPCGVVDPARRYPSGGSPRSPGGPPPPGPYDHVCSIFPPGISLLALPVLAPFVLAGVPASDGGALIRAGHLAAALIEVFAALLLWAVVRRFTTDRWALLLLLLYWLATSVRTVASQALWQHAGVHLALALALWLMLHERPPSRRRELLAGLALGFGVVVRQTSALPALLAARWGPRGPRMSGIALLGGVLVGALPLFAYQQLAFGSALESGYGAKPFDAPVLSGLYGLLLSPSRGLFIYEPWTIAGLAGLMLAWRREGHVALRLRGLSIAWLATLFLYASYVEWWGGRVFGPRFLDDLAPVVVAASAWGVGQGLLRGPWALRAFALAAAWSLVLFNAAALVYDPAGWDTLPTNVNFDPGRLFVWSDPQWLAVLSSGRWSEPAVLAAALLSAVVLALLLRVELRTRAILGT